MRPIQTTTLSFVERLNTFNGHWDNYEATARQLAAIGHVYDRPPLEAIEEGSRCASCSAFVKRERSIKVLGGPLGTLASGGDEVIFDGLEFHDPGCIRLQIRIPLDFRSSSSSGGGYSMTGMKMLWERRSTAIGTNHSSGELSTQKSCFFSLPTELRLEIYAMLLPRLEKVTTIVPLNRDSGRIVTSIGHEKIGPRDLTKTNILCTCRAVHEEALDLLFKSITYKFDSTKTLYLFLRHIGPHGRQLLRLVDVSCGFREDAITFALLATCSRLKTMTIRMARPRLMIPDAPLWIADGVSCLLDISGLEALHFGACGKALYMDERKPDAAIIRQELTRSYGTSGQLKCVDGRPDV